MATPKVKNDCEKLLMLSVLPRLSRSIYSFLYSIPEVFIVGRKLCGMRKTDVSAAVGASFTLHGVSSTIPAAS
jgi:hypothetical protein